MQTRRRVMLHSVPGASVVIASFAKLTGLVQQPHNASTCYSKPRKFLEDFRS
jgi:hypothetical protein